MKPKKSLGQNFLKDKNILKNCRIGKFQKNDIILEIGPGTGNLTEKILKKNQKNLLLLKKIKIYQIFLKKKFGNKIKIINKDILNVIINLNLINQ